MKGLIRFLIRHLPRPLLIRFSYIFSWVFRFWYKGDKVECPICQNSFSKFLPYGVSSRENVLCPACLSLERHRLIWLYLRDETDFFNASYKVLHVAPEQSFLKRFRAMKNLDYTTADLESPLADIHFDLHEIPLDDNQYDFFICNHVLEHVDDYKKVLSEILRVLKPGGRAILQVPLDYTRDKTYEDKSIVSSAAREEHFGQKDHLRVFGLDYPNRLKDSGFVVDEISYSHKLGEDLSTRFRLDPQEVLYLAKKPTV